MTREQETSKVALEYANEEIFASPYDAFMAGAQWADQHPVNYDGKAMLYVNNRSHENGYKEAIDKVCDWLRVELDKEEELHYIHVHGFDKERREIFLEELKKAMKEQIRDLKED